MLQQELELVKVQCLMNSEKLAYNYQVLKKREEENLIVQAQQKRRINRCVFCSLYCPLRFLLYLSINHNLENVTL